MNDKYEKNLNILVFDPDDDFARDVKLFLEDTYCVDTRSTIDQLDYTIILNKIDVIIIAIDSIDETALHMIDEIRNNHLNIKIMIMYTYITSDKQIEQKLAKCTDDMITKPFDVTLLREKIVALLFQLDSYFL